MHARVLSSTNASFDEAAKARFPSRQGVAAGDHAAPARVPVRDWGVASASRPPSRRRRRNPRRPRSSGTCSSQLPGVVLANPRARRALSPGRISAPEGAVQCDPSLAGCPSTEACPLARVTSREIDVTRTGVGLPELLSRLPGPSSCWSCRVVGYGNEPSARTTSSAFRCAHADRLSGRTRPAAAPGRVGAERRGTCRRPAASRSRSGAARQAAVRRVAASRAYCRHGSSI